MPKDKLYIVFWTFLGFYIVTKIEFPDCVWLKAPLTIWTIGAGGRKCECEKTPKRRDPKLVKANASETNCQNAFVNLNRSFFERMPRGLVREASEETEIEPSKISQE